MESIRFRRRIGIGVALSALSVGFQLIAFLVNNLLAHVLGPGPFAHYSVVTTDYGLFMILAEFGTNAVILALFAGRLHRSSIAWSILAMRWGLAILSAVGMFGVAFGIHSADGLRTPVAIMSMGLLFSPGLLDWFFLGTRRWKNFLRFKLIHASCYLAGGGILFFVGFDSLKPISALVVIAPIPAMLYGLKQFPFPQKLRLRESQRKMIRAIFRRAVPFAVSSLASFAYLPILIYAMNLSWGDPHAKAAFTAGHKLMLVLTGIVVQFITSEQVHHNRRDALPLAGRIRRTAAYTTLALVGITPLLLFAPQLLKLLFFGLEWSAEMEVIGAHTVRILSLSILLQFARLPALVQLLADRKFILSMWIVLAGGLLNILMLSWAVQRAPEQIALAGLSGDLLSTTLMLLLFFRTRPQRLKEG